MLQRIITYLFYFLLIVTPLVFWKYNSELFEYNKMMVVYAMSVIICAAWIIRMVVEKRFIWKKTPLDLPIFVFLLSQILSTIFSMDIHTSIWGYYSRSNGGLLSIISYVALFYALVSNISVKDALNLVKAALIGGLLVTIWAIPEHFGHSFSCWLIQREFDDACWVQQVQDRVFASLGQPNWLAAYLEMLIFPALYFALTAKKWLWKIGYGLLAIAYYMAFTFTYSRGATIGIAIGIAFFLALQLFPFKNSFQVLRALIIGWVLESIYRLFADQKNFIHHLTASKIIKQLALIIVLLVLVNALFGSALTGNFKLIKESAAPARPGITAPSVGTQLENGGTESGQIRLIVWKGALDIFRHYPIFGSGVETFAYSYYNFRPQEHNMVSEWDFLYNKAHNEYVNYLATTGIVGFGSYMFLIISFLIWSFKTFLKYSKKPDKNNANLALWVAAIACGYIAYLIQNFFGFSVVIIALLFFLFPALSFVEADAVEAFEIPNKAKINTLARFGIQWNFNLSFLKKIGSYITANVLVKSFDLALLAFISFILLFKLFSFWRADEIYSLGTNYSDSGNPGRAYNYLKEAVDLNSGEPLYHSELGYAAASASVALSDAEKDSSDSAVLTDSLKQEAISETQRALSISPANTSLWRTAIRTYYQISLIDPLYDQKTLDTVEQTIKLAPTDPKLYYNKALILAQLNRNDEAVTAFQKALELKPDYHEALFDLGVTYQQMGKIDKAKEQMETILKYIPGDEGATQKLQELATASAQKK